jgi:hypothetical protein
MGCNKTARKCDGTGGCILQNRQLHLNLLRQIEVISIEGSDQVAMRFPDRKVSVGGNP